MSNRTCTFDGCQNRLLARGLCGKHYRRWSKHGDPAVGGHPERPDVCTAEGCDRDPISKGLCGKHYQRLKKTETTHLDYEPKTFRSAEESFAAQTRRMESGCIEWTGRTNRKGYGRLSSKGKMMLAHRYAWTAQVGEIPSGMLVDHMCWNPACVNVEHMRLCTQSQNGQNREGAEKGSRSGIRGVHWHPSSGMWQVSVVVSGKRHRGGYFHDKEEAGRVAAEMRAELMPYSQN